ncbi:MAG: helix-turn-helix domain-containing protein [Candidatus Binataceae bacterium]
MEHDKPEKLLIRPVEVAAMLSISRSSAYELIAAGTIPSVRLGRMVRVPLEAIRRIVEQRRDDAL